MKNRNSISIVIELCPDCGGEMVIDRQSTSACGNYMGYVTAECPNCGYQSVVYVVVQKMVNEDSLC